MSWLEIIFKHEKLKVVWEVRPDRDVFLNWLERSHISKDSLDEVLDLLIHFHPLRCIKQCELQNKMTFVSTRDHETREC